MKNIKKENIIKYAGISLISLSVIASGIAIYDANVDHTKEVCQISKINESLYLDSDLLSVGDSHQLREMKNDLNDKGIKGGVFYEKNHTDTSVVRQYTPADKSVFPDGSVSYFAPVGYELEYLDDGYIAYRDIEYKSNIGPAYVIITQDGEQVLKKK